jgi:putative acetyltransferase
VTRQYAYVGPDDIRDAVAGGPRGDAIATRDDLVRWLAAHVAEREGDSTPATYTVGVDGVLRIASRRSEHVACAGGERVLAAGELFVARDARVVGASNQSTGYCPEPACWSAVEAALGRAGIRHPGRFTDAIAFRRCVACGQRNLVKDDDYTCAVCDGVLPRAWNFDITIEPVTEPTDEIRALVGELEADLAAGYPPEQRHGLALDAIFEPHIRFFIARLDGVAVGCGGVALFDDFAEVKRMYVRDTVRGRGVAPSLLARIESATRDAGLARLRLETGDKQLAAIRFYERSGFVRRGAFGAYAAMDPHAIATSIFFEKTVA